MADTYSTFAVADLLDAFASSEPVPGGGSAAALAGAVGVSLLMMVAGNPRTRTGTDEAAADLAGASARLRPLRETLAELVDRDSHAYRAVVDAMRLPKTTPAEQAARRDAVAAALRQATEVPLETMRACQQALRGAVVVAEHGNPNAASDTGVAIELLMTAIRGAALNVEVNLRSLTDHGFADRVMTERSQLESDAGIDARRASGSLRPPS